VVRKAFRLFHESNYPNCRSNNGKLLGLFISESSIDSIEITLKITLGAMNEIIQTFRRYNYEIISEHQEDNYINNLKERSDYLDKYLNI
jgi:hypothetical protein